MILRVALDAPLHPSLPELFDYRWTWVGLSAPQIGQRVLIPFGQKRQIGLIADLAGSSSVDPAKLRDAVAVLDDVAPLPPDWFALVRFAAGYYQRSLGDVALSALPAVLRRAAGYRPDRKMGEDVSCGAQLPRGTFSSRSVKLLRKTLVRRSCTSSREKAGEPGAVSPEAVPQLAPEQERVAKEVHTMLGAARGFQPVLLHGITGSGKTEIYLRAIAEVLQRGQQVLVLIPEINLSPQLQRVFSVRFPSAVVAHLNSGMADSERALHWLTAHEGQADVLLGTRMAVLAPMPRLGLIVVDEEHDPSFKQHEGLRYSARDLAVVRAQQSKIPIILGSATPSLESWMQSERGKYVKLVLASRVGQHAELPVVKLVGLKKAAVEHGFTTTLRSAILSRLERGEQSLVFHNRRGYAPVLACGACGWLSACSRCSVYTVFHKIDKRLHCHHCGWNAAVPKVCPDCGNVDLAPLGRGTQRIEETLAAWFPEARVARLDRDSTRRRGTMEAALTAVHAGEVDILVGTQMVAKGHDFRDLSLVGVVDADSALFSHDFRAAERIFSTLMQVAGRAGRGAMPGEVLIQTRYPEHPLFAAVVAHDFARFARSQLSERRAAGLPPFSHQAVLRAEAETLEAALAFLNTARQLAQTPDLDARADASDAARLYLYDPVPMSLMRVANVERAQLVIETRSRRVLQGFLPKWLSSVRQVRTRVKWHLEVDPLEI